MTRTGPRRRDERGVGLASPLALLSAVAVVLAGAAFVATSAVGDEDPAGGPASAGGQPTTSPSGAADGARPAQPARSPRTSAASAGTGRPKATGRPTRAKPVVRRSQTYVEVFNNSRISGLAASTAARAQDAGWQVVGSDNWYGAIPASTVYYPPGLEAAARLLGRDLHISRLRAAIPPMRGDRLTVILTSDYT